MRRRLGMIAAVLVTLAAMGCGHPSDALKRHFKTSPPRGVRVVHFTGDAFKDPWFVWEVAPVDRAFVKALVANAGLAAAPPGMDRGDPSLLDLPAWWPRERLPRMAELYYRDPGPTDGSFYRVWVDREQNRLYIFFMNT